MHIYIYTYITYTMVLELVLRFYILKKHAGQVVVFRRVVFLHSNEATAGRRGRDYNTTEKTRINLDYYEITRVLVQFSIEPSSLLSSAHMHSLDIR